jgi:hypothetical protein
MMNFLFVAGFVVFIFLTSWIYKKAENEKTNASKRDLFLILCGAFFGLAAWSLMQTMFNFDIMQQAIRDRNVISFCFSMLPVIISTGFAIAVFLYLSLRPFKNGRKIFCLFA